MSSLSIGLSSLAVSQRLLDLTGQNIANANTPNYHRQVAELAARISGSAIGAGVEVKNITRVVNQLVDEAVQRNVSDRSNTSAQLAGLNQLQGYLAPGDGTINDLLNKFFDSAAQLSVQPSDLSQRRVVLATASALTDQINDVNNHLAQMSTSFVSATAEAVKQVNTLAAKIAQFNVQIQDSSVQGGPTNDLIDGRQEAVAQLSQLVDARVVPQQTGQVNVFVAGVPLVLNGSVTALSSFVNSQKQLVVTPVGSKNAMAITGGKIAGLASLYNTTLPKLREQFDTFTNELVTQLDSIQASGLGLDGPLKSTVSQNSVAQPNTPLFAAGLVNPPKAGNLYVTVTDLATGARTLNKVSFDPGLESLSDLAAKLNTIPNLQVVLNSQAGKLNVIAKNGYGFDFTGNFSTSPDTSAITGTTVPTLSGTYTGNANDTLTFRFSGPGTIGSTPGLALNAYDASGALLKSLNVGLGYEAGTTLPDVAGVKVKLTSGGVNASDEFTLNVAANPDTGGILAALGIHSFFVGDAANGLHVNPDLLAHPELFALSVSGDSGDGGQLARIVALRDKQVLNNNSQSLSEFFLSVIGDVGGQVNDVQSRDSAFQSLGKTLDQQQQSSSGVDPNEELIKLVQYQRAFQMSARYITVVNQTLDALLQIA